MRTKFLLILTFLIIVSFLFAQRKEVEWKGKVKYENGIKVIKNPKNPLFGKIKFDLVEDLSIGSEEDENSMFYGGVKIGVDDENNIYVLDFGNCRIQKFDKEGNYIKTFGRKGQGPGEFEMPIDIYVDKNIYVLEFIKIHLFDKSGKFIRTIKPDNFVDSCSEMVNESFLAKVTSYRKEGRFSEIAILNSKGKIIKSIVDFPSPLRSIRKKGIVFGVFNPYEPRLYFCPLKGGKGIYGYSSRYRLFVINLKGKIELIFEKAESPSRITKKDKNKLINKYLKYRNKELKGKDIKLSKGDVKRAFVFPKYRPFYNEIMCDNLNNIYIRKLNSVLKKKKEITFDFFNSKGFYLYEIKIPEEPEIIGNGYIYTYIVDEAGYFKIKRYKIRNWDNIKKLSTFSLQD